MQATFGSSLWRYAVVLGLASSPIGCEAISSMVGMAKVAKELGKHLKDDLGAELTDAKIDKALVVTPALREFSDGAEHKWDLDPDAPDFSKFASAMGAMSDYIAFFESHDTRLTEYYVDMVKIADARALIGLRKAHAEAVEKHDKEREELEAKLAAAAEPDKAAVQTELERNAKAKETLEKAFKEGQEAREKVRKQGGNSYKLTDEEVARVEARAEEIDKVLDKKKKKKDADE
ncbi:MAG: hypothetical protein AAF721_34155 [Myxococcota bacterium]